VWCKHETDAANEIYDIVCRNVGSLLSGRTYYVSAKIWFIKAHTFTDPIKKLNFGRVTINAVTYDDTVTNLELT